VARLTFEVRVTPRAGRDRVDGAVDGVLRVRVAAAPAEGAANEAVLRLLAAELDAPRSAVTLVTGAAARRKRVAVEGITRTAVLARWPGLGV
jgi:uncharacterized protein YggU (UPF0235/DUF167 family)